jgi:PhnB protein
MAKPKPMPDGYHTTTPHLTVNGAEKAIEFYKNAFGAHEIMRMPGPGGKGLMHAEIKIGDSIIMLADEHPRMGERSPQSLGGCTGSIYLYVENVDSVCAKALAAGATARGPVSDMFWGDRVGRVADPFGQEWSIATHTEDLSNEEIGKRAQAFMAKMSASGA